MAVYSYTKTPGALATTLPAFVDFIEGQLTAHSAWSKVDSISRTTTGATPVTTVCSVWRNAGTQNSFGADFYLFLWRVPSDAIYAAVAEGYNPATASAIRPVPIAAVGDVTAPSPDFSYLGGADVPLFTSTNTINNNVVQTMFLSSTASLAQDVWVNITKNTFTCWSRYSTTVRNVNMGIGDSFLSPDPFPLYMVNNSAGSPGVSRFPFVVAPQASNWRLQSVLTTVWTPRVGNIGGAGDRLFNQRPIATRPPLFHDGSPDTHGYGRGLTRDLLSFSWTGTIPALGDTVVINSELYAFILVTGTASGTVVAVNTTTP